MDQRELDRMFLEQLRRENIQDILRLKISVFAIFTSIFGFIFLALLYIAGIL